VAACQYHTFRDSEFHFTWRQVGDHHGQSTDQLLGAIGGFDPREHVTVTTLAYIERQAKQFGGTVDVFAIDDASNPQVDLGKVVDRNRRADSFPAR